MTSYRGKSVGGGMCETKCVQISRLSLQRHYLSFADLITWNFSPLSLSPQRGGLVFTHSLCLLGLGELSSSGKEHLKVSPPAELSRMCFAVPFTELRGKSLLFPLCKCGEDQRFQREGLSHTNMHNAKISKQLFTKQIASELVRFIKCFIKMSFFHRQHTEQWVCEVCSHDNKPLTCVLLQLVPNLNPFSMLWQRETNIQLESLNGFKIWCNLLLCSFRLSACVETCLRC